MMAPAGNPAPADQPRRRDVVGLLGLAGVTLMAALLISLPSPRGNIMALVYAPWLSNEQILMRVMDAGGAPIRAGVLPGLVFAHLEGSDPGESARRAGAWLAFDAQTPIGCFSSNTRQGRSLTTWSTPTQSTPRRRRRSHTPATAGCSGFAAPTPASWPSGCGATCPSWDSCYGPWACPT